MFRLPLRDAYLFGFNLMLVTGCVELLWSALIQLQGKRDFWGLDLWPMVSERAEAMHVVAAVEMLHAAAGVSRFPVSDSVMASRNRALVMFIGSMLPAVQDSPFFATMAISWAMIPVLRFSFFLLPHTFITPVLLPIHWLRFAAFHVFNALSIACEVSVVARAVEHILVDRLPIHVPSPMASSPSFPEMFGYFLIVHTLLTIIFRPSLPSPLSSNSSTSSTLTG